MSKKAAGFQINKKIVHTGCKNNLLINSLAYHDAQHVLTIGPGRLVLWFPVHARAWLQDRPLLLVLSRSNLAKVCLALCLVKGLVQELLWGDLGFCLCFHPFDTYSTCFFSGAEMVCSVLLPEMSFLNESFLWLYGTCQTCPNTCLQGLSIQQ